MTASPVDTGGAIIFVDEMGVSHAALVTTIHGSFGDQEGNWTRAELDYAGEDVVRRLVGTPKPPPSVNLVYVSKDERNRDPYGQQIERRTSVPYQGSQAAQGFYWRNV